MNRKAFALALAAVLIAGSPLLASEETGTELLFDRTAFADVLPGTAVHYSHARNADENIPFKPIEAGKILVTHVEDEGSSHSEVTLFNGRTKRKLHYFPISSGNPIFVAYLESSVSSVAFATKGSPFYIRNRFKDAFSTGGETTEITEIIDGEEVTATRIRYAPFKNDRNAAKIGRAFSALTMTFVLSDAVPGRFVSMRTEAIVDDTPYFVEAVRFIDAKPSSE